MKSKSRQTRFPVARIKKIMQKDEDVGKVAQATPVLISKALEIFMQKLVDEASKQASSKGSKKIATYHLKRCVEQVEMFDFLKEIVSGVADPGEKADKGGAHDRGEDGDEPKRRRGRGPAKKPRAPRKEKGALKDEETVTNEGFVNHVEDNGKPMKDEDMDESNDDNDDDDDDE